MLWEGSQRYGTETVLVPALEAQPGQVWREPQETNPSTHDSTNHLRISGISTSFTVSRPKYPVPGLG